MILAPAFGFCKVDALICLQVRIAFQYGINPAAFVNLPLDIIYFSDRSLVTMFLFPELLKPAQPVPARSH